jgi:hypothetical protein
VTLIPGLSRSVPYYRETFRRPIDVILRRLNVRALLPSKRAIEIASLIGAFCGLIAMIAGAGLAVTGLAYGLIPLLLGLAVVAGSLWMPALAPNRSMTGAEKLLFDRARQLEDRQTLPLDRMHMGEYMSALLGVVASFRIFRPFAVEPRKPGPYEPPQAPPKS